MLVIVGIHLSAPSSERRLQTQESCAIEHTAQGGDTKKRTNSAVAANTLDITEAGK